MVRGRVINAAMVPIGEAAVSLESTGELRRVYRCYRLGRYENDAGEVAGCRQHSPQRHFLGGFRS